MDTISGEVYSMSQGYKNNWRIIDLANGVKVTGCMPSSVQPGDQCEFEGEWVVHPTYGKQFKANGVKITTPKSEAGTMRYLERFKWIGPAMSSNLWREFGDSLFEIIEQDPERLTVVRGITKSRAKEIHDGYLAIKEDREIDTFFASNGITVNMVHRLKAHYGGKKKAYYIIRSNPYKLATDVWGIGFKRADRVALSIGFGKDSPERIKAGILYTLSESSLEGHCFLRAGEIIQRSARNILGMPDRLVAETLQQLATEGSVVVEGDGYWLERFRNAEINVARLVLSFVRSGKPSDASSLRKRKSKYESRLNKEQAEALRSVIENRISIITGGPGTGKTFAIDAIASAFSEAYGSASVFLAAPTGKAAKRMEEATQRRAQTIHRLLGFNPISGDFVFGKGNPLQGSLVVVDEISMVDLFLMEALMSAIDPNKTRVLFVGDKDQLPSVGPGSVLGDMIWSGRVPTIFLSKIMRQAEGSLIIKNASRVNSGEWIEAPGPGEISDFYWKQLGDPEEIARTIIDTVSRIPDITGIPLDGIQVLCPQKKSAIGTAAMNGELRLLYNGGGKRINSSGLYVGDRVIQTRNNYKLGVFNGEIGYIVDHDESLNTASIVFNPMSQDDIDKGLDDYSTQVDYPVGLMDELIPAYALTIHKSQGSEFDAVIIPIHTANYIMLKRNLLYTAITRGKKLVVVVGSKKAMKIAIRTRDTSVRNTMLEERLRE